LRAELADRYGELPDEVDNLSELMLLKAEMRELQLRAIEAGPGRLVISLGQDPRLEPAKLATMLQRSKGIYRLTPDMRLIAKVPEGLKGLNLLNEAKKVLRELGKAAEHTS
jgi:transcription-repair coupling factor (superfamily II helicase)